MKKVFILIGFCSLAYSLYSQQKGIQFETGLSWERLLEKAKNQNKLIFIDCFTTWCAPCKQMEREVYSLEKVGQAFNSSFISVKLQMDTSLNDSPDVKMLYRDARNIKNGYSIDAYPSYLFFNSDGKIIYREKGRKKADDFISLARLVSNPKTQYYNLLENYRNGKRDTFEMTHLAKNAKVLGENKLAEEVANEYIKYLSKEDFFAKNNVEFIQEFTQSTKQLGFRLFYKNTRKIDSIMKNEDFAEAHISYLISKEELDPIIIPIWKSSITAPNWDKIQNKIEKRYNRYYSERVVTNAKVRWYEHKRNWSEFTKNLVIYVEKYALNQDMNVFWNRLSLNNNAWKIFERSESKNEIDAAINWMEDLFKAGDSEDPEYIDTYANLLYKMGKKELAIEWEQKALRIMEKVYPQGVKQYQEVLNKMKKGEPTWPIAM